MDLLRRIKHNVSQNGGGKVSVTKIVPCVYDDRQMIDNGYKKLTISLSESTPFNNLNQSFIDSFKNWIAKTNPSGVISQYLYSVWSIECDKYEVVIVHRNFIETIYIKKK